MHELFARFIWQIRVMFFISLICFTSAAFSIKNSRISGFNDRASAATILIVSLIKTKKVP